MIIGVGCDIVKIERIRKAMKQRGFPNYLTTKEKELYDTIQEIRKAEWLAGRFAAKEAIYKAIHKVKPCVISQIEVLCDKEGAPYCTIHDYDVWVSIAHEQEYATAYAIVTTKE